MGNYCILWRNRGGDVAQRATGCGSALALLHTRSATLFVIVLYQDRWRPPTRYYLPAQIREGKYESVASISGVSNSFSAKICGLTRIPRSLGDGYWNKSLEEI